MIFLLIIRGWHILRQAVWGDSSPPSLSVRSQDGFSNGLGPEARATGLLMALLSMMSGVCFADQDAPLHARVSVQFIEVSHPVLTELLSGDETGGPRIHAKVMEFSKSGKAKILETAMVVCRSGQKATVESIREEIFPTETEPPSLPGSFFGSPNEQSFSTPPAMRSITAFETKNTGVTLDVEPIIGENEKMIDLRIRPEFVQRLRLETMIEHKDQWGDSSLRMPIFEKWGMNTPLILQPEKFELATVITPKEQPPAPAPSRRVLLFVRVDVIK